MDIARNLVDAARNLTTSAPDPERAYRLRTDEHVPDGIRRIARGQLQDARDELDGTPPRRRRRGRARDAQAPQAPARVRAPGARRDRRGRPTSARTPRCAWPARRISGAARRAGPARDARRADRALRRRAAGGRDRRLRDRLEEEQQGRDGRCAAATATAPIAATRATIDDALARTTTWTFERDGFDALSPGLRRIYRRGRKAMRAAREDPSAENLHEWRKRVKDLWHATEIVRRAPGPSGSSGSRAARTSCRACSATTTTCTSCARTSWRTRSASTTRRSRQALLAVHRPPRRAAVREGARPRPQALRAPSPSASCARSSAAGASARPPRPKAAQVRLTHGAPLQHARRERRERAEHEHREHRPLVALAVQPGERAAAGELADERRRRAAPRRRPAA